MSKRPQASRRRSVRAELLGRSALCGALAGALGGLAAESASALPSLSGSQVAPGAAAPSFSNTSAGRNGLGVTLNAPRTVIDWNSYVVNTNETVNYTFNARSDIVLNRVADPNQVSINGIVNAFVQGGGIGGNVWFAASGGIIIGQNAHINVGGLLATTARLNDVNGFLSGATNLGFTYASTTYPRGTAFPNGTYYPNGTGYPGAPGYGEISVLSGAQITAAGGLVALIAPFVSVAPGAVVGGAGDTLVSAANAYTVSIGQQTAGDLDMLQFVINDPSTLASPLALDGAVKGQNVYVAALTPGSIANAVVDITGTVTATQASAGVGGDIILSSGANTLRPGQFPTLVTPMGQQPISAAAAALNIGNVHADGSAILFNPSGSIAQAGGASLTGGDFTLSAGPTSLGDVNLTGSFSYAAEFANGAPTFSAAAITAGSISILAAGDVSTGTLQATAGDVRVDAVDSGALGYGAINTGDVTASGAIDLEGASVSSATLTAGSDITAKAFLGEQTGEATTINVNTVSAPGAILLSANPNGYASTSSVSLTSGELRSPTGAGSLTLSAVGAGSQVILGAGGSGESFPLLTGRGAVELSSGGTVSVDLLGDAALDQVNAMGDITLLATGSLSANTVSTTAGNIVVQSVYNPGTAFPTGLGLVSLGAATAQAGSIDVEGSAVTAGTLTAATGMTVSSYADSAGDSAPITITKATTSGGNLTILAMQPAADSSGTSFPTGLGLVSLGDASAPAGALDVEGFGVTATGTLSAGSGLTVRSYVDANGNLGAINIANATTTGGDISILGTQVTTDPDTGSVELTQGVAPIALGTVSSAGALDVEGLNITATSLSAVGGVSAYTFTYSNGETTSTNAFADIGTISTGGPGGIQAADGYVSLTNLTFSNGSGTTPFGISSNFGDLYLGYTPGGTGQGGGTGRITGTGALSIYAGGDVNVDLSGPAAIALINVYTGAINVSADSLTIDTVNTSSQDARFTARTGDLAISDIEGQAAVYLDATLGNAMAATVVGSDLYVTAAKLAEVDNATTQSLQYDPINLTGASALLKQASSQGDINVTATAGSATVGDVSLAGNLTIRAAGGPASLHSATFDAGLGFAGVSEDGNGTGALSLTATGTGGAVTLGSAAGDGFVTGAGQIDLNAATDVRVGVSGPVALNTVVAGGSAAVNANAISLDSLQAGLDASLTTTAASQRGEGPPPPSPDVAATTLVAGRDVTVTSAGAATLPSVSAGRNLTLTADSLALGPLAATPGGAIQISSASAFTDTSPLTAGVSVSVSSEGALALGDVIGQTGAVKLQAVGPLSFGGGQSGGDFTATNATGLGSGPLTGTSVTAGGAIALSASNITTGALSAGAGVQATAYPDGAGTVASFVDTASARAATSVTLSSNDGYVSLGSLAFTDPSGAGTAQLTSSGPGAAVYLGYAPGGTGAGGGSGSVGGVGLIGLNAVAGDVTADVTGAAAFGTVAGASVNLLADSLTAAMVTATESAALSARNGSAVVQSVTAAGAISISASGGTASLHSARFSQGDGTSFPAGAGLLSLSATGSTGDVSLGQGSGAVAGARQVKLTADRDVAVSLPQALALDQVSAGRDASLTADALQVASLTTGRDALASGMSVAVTAASIGRDLTVNAGSVTLGSASVGRNLSLTGGAVELDALTDTPSGDILIDTSFGALTTGQALSAGGAITLRASGALSVQDLTAGGGAVALNGVSIAGGNVTAAGGVSATASGGGVQLSSAVARAGALTVYAPGGAIALATGQASGAIVLRGGALQLGTLVSGADTTLRALHAISATTLEAGVSGSGALLVAAGVRPGAAGAADAGATLSLGAASAPGAVTLTAPGAISATTLASTNAQVLVGAAQIDTLDGAQSYLTTTPASISLSSASAATGLALAAQGAIRAMSLTAGGAVTASAATSPSGGPSYVDVGSLTAAGASLSAAGGYASLTEASLTGASLTGGGQLTLQASGAGGNVYLGYGQGGTLAAGRSGSLSGGSATLSASGSVFADLAGPATLSTVTAGGGVILRAGSLAAGAVSGPSGVTLIADTGDLSATSLAAANGSVSATAGAGNATVASASGLGVQIAAGQAARLSSGVSTATEAPAGTGGVQVSGASAELDTAASGGDIAVSASAGPALGGDLSAGGDIRIAASGGAATLQSAALARTAGGTGYPQGPGLLSLAATGPTGDVSLGQGHGAVTGARAVELSASRDVSASVIGPLTLDQVTAGRNAALTTVAAVSGPADLSAARLQAAGDVTVSAAGAAVLPDIAPGANLTVTGQTLQLGRLESTPTGNLSLTALAGGLSDASALSAGGGVSASATGPLSLGDVTANGGGVILSGTSLSAGAVSAQGSGELLARNGNLTLASATVGGGLNASATNGTLSLPAARAGGGPLQLSGQSVALGTGSAPGDITLTSVDGLTAAALATPGAIHAVSTASAAPSSVDIGQVAAGGGVSLQAADGYASLSGGTVGGALTLAAAGAAGDVYLGYNPGGALAGGGHALTVSGLTTLTAARTVNAQLAGAANFDSVQGAAVNLRADSLSVRQATGGAGLTLAANAGAVSAGALSAPGGVISVTTPGAAAVASASGQALSVAAGGVVEITTATATGPGGIRLSGTASSLQSGQSAGDISLAASDGAAAGGDLTAGGNVTLAATGGVASLSSLAFTNTANGEAYPNGTGLLAMTATGPTGDVALGGGAGAVTGARRVTLTADRDVLVDLVGPVVLDTVQAGRDGVLSASALSVGSATAGRSAVLTSATTLGAGPLNAGGDISVTAGSAGSSAPAAASLAGLTAGGAVTVMATGAITANAIAARTGALSVAGASVTAGQLTSGLATTVQASGPVQLAGLTSGAGATVSTAGPVTVSGAADAGGALFIASTYDAVTLAAATGVQDVTIAAAGALTAGDLTATGGMLTLTGASVTAGQLTSGAANRVQASGPVSLAGLTSGAGATVSTAGAVTVSGAASSGGSLSIASTSGAVTLAAATGAQDLTIRAAGALTAGDLTATGGMLTLTGASVTAGQLTSGLATAVQAGSGAIQLAGLTSGGDAMLSGPALIYVGGAVRPGGVLNVVSAAGSVTLGPVTAGGDVTVDAAQTLLTGDIASQGSLSLAGASVDGGHVSSAGAAQVRSTISSVVLSGLSSQGATIDAEGEIRLGSASLGAGGGRLTAILGGVSAGKLTGAQDITVSGAGALEFGATTSTLGSVSLTGGLVSAGPVTSGATTHVQSVGYVRLVSLTAGTDATVTAGSQATLGPASVGEDLTVTAQGPATFAATTVGRDLTAAGSGIVFQDGAPSVGRDLSLAATAGTLVAGGQALSAGRNLSLAVSGDFTAGDVTARNGSLSLSGATVSVADVSAAGGVRLNAGAASTPTGAPVLAVGTVTAGDDVTLTSVGSQRVGSLVLTGQGVDVAGDGRVLTLTSTQGDVLVGSNGTTPGGVVSGDTASTVQAGGAVRFNVSGPLALGSVSGGGAVQLLAPSIALGQATAGDRIDLEAQTGGVTATGPLTGVTLVNIQALGPVSVQAATATTGDVTLAGAGVQAGELTSGGNVRVAGGTGAVALGDLSSGGGVSVSGASVSAGSGYSVQGFTLVSTGAAFVSGAIDSGASASFSASDLTLQSVTTRSLDLGISAGALSAGALGSARDLSAAVTGAGPAQIASISAGRDIALSTAGAAAVSGSLAAGRDAVLSAASLTASSLSAGGALQVSTPGALSFTTASAGQFARLLVGTLDIGASLSAPTLSIESASGPLTVGGAAPAGGLWVSGTDFGRIQASTVLNLYAGSTTGTARGDLSVGDLAVNPRATPVVNLYAGPDNTVTVSGGAAPTVNGGTLTIGGTAASGWRPSAILVSGSLGTATRVSDTRFTGVRAFDQLSLHAGGAVLIGSPRFIGLVQPLAASAINIGLNQPAGVAATGAEIGKMFVVAGRLDVSAGGAVVQQNTSGSGTSYSGLYLTNGVPSAGVVLTVDPPTVIDLFGSFGAADGTVVGGAQASRQLGLSVVGLTTTPNDYRFNGCAISANAVCGLTVGPEQGVQLLGDQEEAGIAAATTRPQELTQSVLLTIAPSAQAEDQVDPVVTGTGNEEIWRDRRKDDQ